MDGAGLVLEGTDVWRRTADGHVENELIYSINQIHLSASLNIKMRVLRCFAFALALNSDLDSMFFEN